MRAEQSPRVEVTETLPPGYRLTELGPLPEEWRVVRLGGVVSISKKPRNLVRPNKTPFIPMEAIPDNGTLYPSRIEWRPGKDVRSGVYCEPGDILFAKITPSLENGKQAIVPPQVEFAYATTEVYPLKPSAAVDTLFLFSFLQASWVRELLAGKMEGSTGRQRLAKHALLNHRLPLPPLPEQRAIAQVLRAVQEAKEATERVLAALRELKKSLMRHLFTYGPVAVDATDRVPMQETELGPLPAHWGVVRLEQVTVRSFSGGTPSTANPSYWGGHIPWITSAIIGEDDVSLRKFQRTITEEGLNNSSASVAPADSLLVGTRVGVGKAAVALFDVAINQDLTALILNEEAHPYFLAYLLKMWGYKSWFENNKRGATIKGIPRDELLKLLIPLPPLPEQREIARILRAVDEKIQAEEARKEALGALFKTLLHELMTAKRRLPAEFVAQFAEPLSGGRP
ncbi:restriction endonuclease subunit S [Thermus sp. FJN-A]